MLNVKVIKTPGPENMVIIVFTLPSKLENWPPTYACPSQREGVLTGDQHGCEDLDKM